MIIVITTEKTCELTGRPIRIASHGLDFDTLQGIVLPNETPAALGAVFEPRLGEYVIHDAPQGAPC